MKGSKIVGSNETQEESYFNPFCFDNGKVEDILVNIGENDPQSKKVGKVRSSWSLGPKSMELIDSYFSYN